MIDSLPLHFGPGMRTPASSSSLQLDSLTSHFCDSSELRFRWLDYLIVDLLEKHSKKNSLMLSHLRRVHHCACSRNVDILNSSTGSALLLSLRTSQQGIHRNRNTDCRHHSRNCSHTRSIRSHIHSSCRDSHSSHIHRSLDSRSHCRTDHRSRSPNTMKRDNKNQTQCGNGLAHLRHSRRAHGPRQCQHHPTHVVLRTWICLSFGLRRALLQAVYNSPRRREKVQTELPADLKAFLRISWLPTPCSICLISCNIDAT